MTKILANCLQFDGITENLFHPGQCRGVKKHATIDVGLIITNFIVNSRNRGLFSSILAVDIAQFFPSINHDVDVQYGALDLKTPKNNKGARAHLQESN